jgi:hypothetical protein
MKRRSSSPPAGIVSPIEPSELRGTQRIQALHFRLGDRSSRTTFVTLILLERCLATVKLTDTDDRPDRPVRVNLPLSNGALARARRRDRPNTRVSTGRPFQVTIATTNPAWPIDARCART